MAFESDESAFNFALEYLKSISESLKMCKLHSSHGDIDGWVQWLRITYRELSCKLKEIEDEEFDVIFKEVNKLINDKESKIKSKLLILYKLDQIEIKIRKKLQQKGMLLPSKDDPKFAVLQR